MENNEQLLPWQDKSPILVYLIGLHWFSHWVPAIVP